MSETRCWCLMSSGVRWGFLGAGSHSYRHWRALLQTLAILAAAILAQAAPADARPLRLVALGDSLTSGYGLPAAEAFPSRLQAALREKGWDVEVVNAGVPGDTAADGVLRFYSSVPPDADALILELGANDMAGRVPPEMMKRALSAILDKARSADLPTLVAGMLPAPNLGSEFSGEYSAGYSALAETYHAELYPFFLDGVAGDSKFFQPDGMHPNAEGVNVIVARILPSVERLLRQVRP
jgi:acyl-CoA thioesterase I